MGWQLTQYSLAFALAAPLSVVLGIAAFGPRDIRNPSTLGEILVGRTLWRSGAAVQTSPTTLPVNLLALNITFSGTSFVTDCVFLFAPAYAGHERWLAPRCVAWLVAFHALSLTILRTKPAHRLVLTDASLTTRDGLVSLDVEWGL